MKRLFVVLMLILPLVLVACNRENVTDVERNPDGGVDVTVELTEAEVNTMVTTAINASANPLLRNPSVDLQAGRIVISGERDRADGSGRVNGTITITATVQSGAILFQATEVTFEGLSANDSQVTAINQALADGFNRRANRENPDNRAVNYQSVSITDNNVSFVVNLQRVQ